MGYSCPSWLEDVASFSNGWPVRITSRAGVLSWARMISAAHSTIDIAEVARDIERAAVIFGTASAQHFRRRRSQTCVWRSCCSWRSCRTALSMKPSAR